MNSVLIAVFISELILIILAYSLSNGNLLSPSFITGIVFSVATCCILYNVDFWNVSYSWDTFYIIVAGFCSMMLGEMSALFLANKKRKNRSQMLEYNKQNCTAIHVSEGLHFLLVLILLILILLMAVDVFKRGSYRDNGLYAIGLVKYSKEGLSFVSKLAIRYSWIIIIVYLYIWNNNIFHVNDSLRKNIKYIIPVFLSILCIIISGNRAAIVRIAAIVYVFYIVTQIDVSKKGNVSMFKVAKKVLPIGVAVLAGFYALRGISKVNSHAAQRAFIDYITYYIGSPLYLLDKALSASSKNIGYIGEMTFTSIYQMLGIDVNYTNSFINVGGASSFAGNEFSWFQRPFVDFGFLGMLIFTFLIYFVFGWILYLRISYSISNKRRIKYTVIYAFYFYIIVMSFYYCQVCFAITFYNILTIALACSLLIFIIHGKYRIILFKR